jgi:hypothetical protein
LPNPSNPKTVPKKEAGMTKLTAADPSSFTPVSINDNLEVVILTSLRFATLIVPGKIKRRRKPVG